ncbi:MAG: nucleoside-diphosphate kinase [Thermoplasmatales archaeon]|nr:nucleoside-diphosphate kinase [Thermoplasmatales archaeon]
MRTLVLLKPDAVQRGLVGEIVYRFEKKGMKIAAMKMLRMTKGSAEEFYSVHEGKPFYNGLVDYITSGPIVGLCLEGENVISIVRTMMGKTNPAEAEKGTIRADYGIDIGKNTVHGSDSIENAEKELSIVFDEADFV